MSEVPVFSLPAWRRTAARAVLVLGAVMVGGQIARSAPHDQELVFRLDHNRASLKELSASWTREGDDEPVGGMTLQLSSPVPSTVRHKVSLPNGDYVVSVELHNENPSDSVQKQTRNERRVTLQGGETVIYLGTPGY